MATSIKQFNAGLKRALKDFRGDLSVVHRKIGLDILTGVVLKTPVDTGRARGGWQASVETFNEDELGKEDKSGSSTISSGSTAIAKVRLGQTIYIFNNVSYIVALEKGHSKQAPSGMLSRTLQEIGRGFK